MDIKNTPMLFQQELNQQYKDILNCEITHPEYWAGKVPETFFLKKRKGIDAYHDWGGDDVLDYINYDGSEYAIVRYDNKIRVMKRVEEVSTSSIVNLISMGRIIEPEWGELDFTGSVSDFTITSQYMKKGGSKCYIFTVATRYFEGDQTKELFVTEYQLLSPGNLDYSVQGKTYWIRALSGLIGEGKVQVIFSNTGKSIFVSIEEQRKIFQVKLDKDWDLTSFSKEYIESSIELPKSLAGITDLAISYQTDRLYFVSGNHRVGMILFRYNDISKDNELQTFDKIQKDRKFLGVEISNDGSKIYLTYGGKLFQHNISTFYDISTMQTSYEEIEIGTSDDMSQGIQCSDDGAYFYVQQENKYIVQLGFPHALILTEQVYNKQVNHSFKRDFQSVRGQCFIGVNGDVTATGNTTGVEMDYQITLTQGGSTISDMGTNQFAGNYLYVNGGNKEGSSGTGQIITINNNTNTYLEVNNLAVDIKDATAYVFEDYGEVLAFIGGDGLYMIHNDEMITKYEGIKLPVLDACWLSGRAYVITDNGNVRCSATRAANNTTMLWGGKFAGVFNNYSLIGATTGALRIIPFNDIIVVFTNTCIYVIKKESYTENGTSMDTYILTLAFDFVGLHSRNAICPYNTGIYFVSNKNTFVSLDIQETYYNKYKITTTDLGVDIQQWLDGIESDHEVAIGIDEETIYVTWNGDKYATVFQYDTYYKFRHRRETQTIIKNIRVDNTQTYLGPICYRYNIKGLMKDEGEQPYEQHLRWFNGESDIFSLKTILYHELYLGTETDLSTEVKYNARLSTGTYEYIIPLDNALFLQKLANTNDDGILGHGLLGITPLGGSEEKYAKGRYASDVDILEIPLGLSYSLLEICIRGNFEIGGNIIGSFVHDPHLTPYEDVVGYLNDN